jgi:hypothetical protein
MKHAKVQKCRPPAEASRKFCTWARHQDERRIYVMNNSLENQGAYCEDSCAKTEQTLMQVSRQIASSAVLLTMKSLQRNKSPLADPIFSKPSNSSNRMS